MNNLEIQTVVKVYAEDELPADEREALQGSVDALAQAYAPYSNFRVGAALKLADGKIITGSNQENASFPLGLCAERVALASKSAIAAQQKITAIAVSVDADNNESLVSPCGMCRQALLEAELRQNAPIKVIMAGPDNTVYVVDSVKQLLPLAFSSRNL